MKSVAEIASSLGWLIVGGVVLITLILPGDASADPPSGEERVTDAVVAPANRPVEIKTGTIGTTIAPIFDDLPVSSFGKDYVTQNIAVESDSANAGRICVKSVEIPQPIVPATDTCAEVCTAATVFTCNKTSTDGEWIDANESLPERLTGRLCLCGVASAVGQVYQGRRMAR